MSQTGLDSEAGTTLLEAVCVLAIIAMVAALVYPRADMTRSRLALERLAIDVGTLMKADRYTAIRRGVEISTVADLRLRQVRSSATKRQIAIPEDVSVATTLSGSCPSSDERAAIVFFPDGRSCGGRMTLARASIQYDIQINWLTGGITVAQVIAR